MKLLLIHTKEEKDTLIWLESLLSKLGVSSENFFLNSTQDIDIARFTSSFNFSASDGNNDKNANAPTHILTASPLCPQWFDFLAGFAFGSHIHILIYGQEAISGISKEFASFFTFLGTEATLQTFLEAENEVSRKHEAAMSIINAQQNLLKIGVPVTVGAFAQCVVENRLNEISLFIAAGFSVNSRNNTGVPMLNIAARNGSRDVIRYLLAKGADVNLISEDRGTTALIDSVMAQQQEIMEDLINAGTDLNMMDRNGQTALTVAAGAGGEKTVESLLRAGADPDIADSLGMSARTYASLFQKETILALFDSIAPEKES